MSLLQIAETANHSGFRKRVQASIYKAALQIVGEDPSSYSAEKARKRHDLGTAVLHGGSLEDFSKAVSSQVGEVEDPDTIPDNSIDSTVTAVWDDIAGVKFNE